MNINNSYRIKISDVQVSTNSYLSFNKSSNRSYFSDDFVDVQNNKNITFKESGTILLSGSISGRCEDGIRAWFILEGGEALASSIIYGAYATCEITVLLRVTSATSLSIRNLSAAFTVGGGDINSSFVNIVRLK